MPKELSDFPVAQDSKESDCKAGDLGLTPGLGRPSGEGNGYPLQSSCLENPMDRGTWRVTHGIKLKIATIFSPIIPNVL